MFKIFKINFKLLSCQFKGHKVDNQNIKENEILYCKNCQIPLHIKNGKPHEFSDIGEYREYKKDRK